MNSDVPFLAVLGLLILLIVVLVKLALHGGGSRPGPPSSDWDDGGGQGPQPPRSPHDPRGGIPLAHA
ncbi:MAG: hypothetical protein M3018_01085, partial [Actinomycetota bacterium]|nr:hypothetical protein [Actinomycetota bacterium]